MPLADVSAYLERMDAGLADSQAELTLALGGLEERTNARLWQGRVLVQWEADESAGGCLLRPHLVRRLLQLGATADLRDGAVQLRANSRTVAALGPQHAGLAAQLGQAPALRLTLRFDEHDGAYRGGEEQYVVARDVKRGKPVEAVLLRLTADVHPRVQPAAPDPGASERRSPPPS